MNMLQIARAIVALPLLLAPALWLALALSRPAFAASDAPITILAFGDSLTAGFMLRPEQSFPAQLQMALLAKGHKVRIINAGVSGDTSADGRNRLAWSLEEKPDAVILELGANDALRGLDPALTRANLDAILQTLNEASLPVLIAGMKAPGNFGADYARTFDAIFPDLAKKYAAQLYPFFLSGVALNPALVQSDGLHPTAAGIAEIVARILPDAEALLAKAAARKSAAQN